jgi:hypothetical protein
VQRQLKPPEGGRPSLSHPAPRSRSSPRASSCPATSWSCT